MENIHSDQSPRTVNFDALVRLFERLHADLVASQFNYTSLTQQLADVNICTKTQPIEFKSISSAAMLFLTSLSEYLEIQEKTYIENIRKSNENSNLALRKLVQLERQNFQHAILRMKTLCVEENERYRVEHQDNVENLKRQLDQLKNDNDANGIELQSLQEKYSHEVKLRNSQINQLQTEIRSKVELEKSECLRKCDAEKCRMKEQLLEKHSETLAKLKNYFETIRSQQEEKAQLLKDENAMLKAENELLSLDLFQLKDKFQREKGKYDRNTEELIKVLTKLQEQFKSQFSTTVDSIKSDARNAIHELKENHEIDMRTKQLEHEEVLRVKDASIAELYQRIHKLERQIEVASQSLEIRSTLSSN